ncbi:MAG TPA: SurA N-terminal domain-containing protein, partial [Clostridia bacterium]|nr:SurA N-terminal domain-containing protein [Clostridia bacterium]
MKKRLIITAVILLSILLNFLFSGCKKKLTLKEDLAQVVAVVNGVELTKQDFINTYYNRYVYYATYGEFFDENTESGKESIKILKTSALDFLINLELIRQKAEAEGFNKTTVIGEMEQTLNQAFSNYYSLYANHLKESAPNKSDAELKEIAKQRFWNNAYGYTMESALQYEVKYSLVTNYTDKLKSEYKMSDEDLKKEYDTRLNSQMYYFGNDPTFFEEEYNNGELVLYKPMNYIKVKSILIGIDEKDREKINELREDDPLNVEANNLRAECLAKIRSEAEAVLVQAQADGADFDELIVKYGDDPGMTN